VLIVLIRRGLFWRADGSVVMLMMAMFSFTIFGHLESVNDAAHVLVITIPHWTSWKGSSRRNYRQGRKGYPLDSYDIQFDHVSFRV
jgi:ATP-binding cassette subfamily B protein